MTREAGGRSSNLTNLQSLRGVAVLMVVCLHLFGYGGKYLPHIFLPSWFLAGGAGVDLFFVISGFIITWITFDLEPSWRSALSFALRRIMRIYPLYWLLFLLLMPVVVLRPEWINAASGHKVDLFASFLLLPQLIPPILPVAWTLTHEMYFYVVYACLILLPHRFRSWGVTAWFAAIAMACYLKPVTTWFYIAGGAGTESASYVVAFHPATFEFGVGCLAAYALKRWELPVARIAVMAALGIFIGAAVIVYAVADIPPIAHALLLGGTGGVTVMLAVASDLHGRRAFPHWLGWLGDISYSVYLIHVLVISAIARLFLSLGATGLVSQILFVAATLGLLGWLGRLSFSLVEQRAIHVGKVLGAYVQGGRARARLA